MKPEPFAILLALMVDLLLGDPEWIYHPVRGIGLFISNAEKRIRERKTSPLGLRLWGLLLWAATVSATFIAVYGLLLIAARIHPMLLIALQILLIWLGLAARSLERESGKVIAPLQRGNLPEARKRLSYIVGRDTESLGQEGIIRAAVETVAENTSDGVIAPLFYAFLGGAPLLWAYKAANTLDSMVGYKDEKYGDLGYVSAKMDDLLNYIPARLTALFLILSSLLPGYSFLGSFHVWRRDRRNHKSPNSAHPEAAAAGALGIQLGGDAVYAGKITRKPFIGDARRLPQVEDIRRVHQLMYSATLLFALVCSLIHGLILKGGDLFELSWW